MPTPSATTESRIVEKEQGSRLLDTILERYERFARRPLLATSIVALLTIAFACCVDFAAGPPEPQVHDELAQVVMADIFAHGRLCEPTQPFWQHFEAIHVLSQPCYQGKYPPALALFMALGSVLFGQPIAGIRIADAVMVATAAYAMYAWLPPSWALLGVSLIAIRFGIVGDWAQSYWGGAASAAGGALVAGGMRRIVTTPHPWHGAATGAGLVLLALSRPYEGLALTLAVISSHVRPLTIAVRGRREFVWRSLSVAIAVTLGGFAWLGYYNYRVTGSPITLPYSLYERTHSRLPLFIWQSTATAEPAFRNPEMQEFERRMSIDLEKLRSNFPFGRLRELASVTRNFVNPLLGLAFLGLLWTPRHLRSAATAACLIVGGVLASNLATSWTAPRYVAPATVAIFTLGVIGLAGLTQRLGRSRATIVLCVAIIGGSLASTTASAVIYVRQQHTVTSWWQSKKTIRSRLLSESGDDLVFVHYDRQHNPHNSWIYNGADLDTQPVIWARQIEPSSDRELRNHYGSRHAWIVFADEQPARLVPWTDESQ